MYDVKKIFKSLKDEIEGADVTYINALANTYREYALVVLTFNYYIFYENGMDYDEYKQDDISSLINEINVYIKKYIVEDNDITDESILSIDALRNNIIKKVDILLKYTAKFYMYEYILNRLEYNFSEPIENSTIKIDDDNFANRVIEYIFNTRDDMLVNSRIRDVIGQLPVRMTKIKFFDLLKDSFSIYKGSSSEGFDAYVDRIMSSGTLYDINESDKIEVLHNHLEIFDEIDYMALDRESFIDLQERYRTVSRYIEVYTNFYTDYMNILNKIYVCMLSKRNISNDEYNVDVIRNACDIIENINKCFESNYTIDINEDISNKLVCLEGIQEKSYDLCMRLEQGIEEQFLLKYEDKDSRITRIITDMKKCSKLITNSLFMSLDEIDTKVVDEDMIQVKLEELIVSFKDVFKRTQKVYQRAVMANVLSEMPVFFNDIAEVSEYIRTQITSCKNESEKMACYAILADMMEDE